MGLYYRVARKPLPALTVRVLAACFLAAPAVFAGTPTPASDPTREKIEKFAKDGAFDECWDLRRGPQGGAEHIRLVTELLKHREGYRRSCAIEILEAWGVREALPLIAERLDDADAHVAVKALEAVIGFSDPAYAQKAAQAAARLGGERDADGAFWRTDLLKQLRRLGEGPFRRIFAATLAAEGLGERDPGRRRAAVEFLTILGAKDQAKAVAGLLKDPDPGVRKAAVLSLGALGSKEHMDQVAWMAGDDRQPLPVRFAALRSLRLLGAEAKAKEALAKLSPSRPELIRAAAAFLVKRQLEDGSWPQRTTVRPGLHGAKDQEWAYGRKAVTALVVLALAAVDSKAQTYALPDAQRAAVSGALAKGRKYLKEGKTIFTADPFDDGFVVWALAQDPADRAALDGPVNGVLAKQQRDGGFGNRFYKASFHTAVVLGGLVEAKSAGAKVPPESLERAARALRSSRDSEGFFSYHTGDRAEGKTGAAARSVACQYVLYRYAELAKDKVEEERRMLAQLLPHYAAALPVLEKVASEIGGRAEPHSGPQQVANYYYAFSLPFAAKSLRAAGGAAGLAERLELSVLSMQEEPGLWDGGDGPSYHTASAVLALTELP